MRSVQVIVSDVDEREHDYIQQLSYRVAHDELTSAKAPGTTLNSTEATAAMSWSFIVLLVVVDDVVVLFLMQIKNYEIKLSYKYARSEMSNSIDQMCTHVEHVGFCTNSAKHSPIIDCDSQSLVWFVF